MKQAFHLLAFVFLFFSTAFAAGKDINSELIYRTSFGRPEDISILLQRGADPNAINIYGVPAIAVAADRKDEYALPIARILLDAGADINKKDSRNTNALVNAIRNENAPLVSFLLDNGANFLITDNTGKSTLDLAKSTGNKQVIALMEEAIANYQRMKAEERSPENLLKLGRDLAHDSCATAYYRFILQSEQESDKTLLEEYTVLEEQYRKSAAQVAYIITGIFDIKPDELKTMRETSEKKIMSELEAMRSNRGRKGNGVGERKDMEKRCNKLASIWQLKDPSLLKQPPTQTPVHQ